MLVRLSLNAATLVALVGILGSSAAAQPEVRRPIYLGIRLVENPRRGGMEIVEVARNGPAWRDGQLRPSDVITHIDGRRVRCHADVEDVLDGLQPGVPVTMELRDRWGRPFWIWMTPDRGAVLYGRPGAPDDDSQDADRPDGRPGRP